jgi:ribonuclease HI
MPDFTCERCSRVFTLGADTLAKYPGWTPKLCTQCRSETRGAGGRGTTRGGARSAGSAGGASKGASRGSTRGIAQTTAQVLERYHGGPQTGVFTDGSCSGNPGPGGWGAVRVEDGNVVEQRSGGDPQTTNNRMELIAMAEGLEMIRPDETIDVFSDSRLVVQTVTEWAAGWERRGWKRSTGEVMNLDLVQRAYRLAQARPGARIQWIRAHDGSRWNEYADALAESWLAP